MLSCHVSEETNNSEKVIIDIVLIVMKYRNAVFTIIFVVYNFHICLGSAINRNFSDFLFTFYFLWHCPPHVTYTCAGKKQLENEYLL